MDSMGRCLIDSLGTSEGSQIATSNPLPIRQATRCHYDAVIQRCCYLRRRNINTAHVHPEIIAWRDIVFPERALSCMLVLEGRAWKVSKGHGQSGVPVMPADSRTAVILRMAL
jgi:hypothetical protein